MAIAPYGSSPVFDENGRPDSLRSEHITKNVTWGLLRALEGEVRLVFINPLSECLVIIDDPEPIPPQSPHFVKLSGPMKIQVEFYREHSLNADNSDG